MRLSATEIPTMSDNEPAQILPEDETLRVNEWEESLTLVIGGALVLLGLFYLFLTPGRHSHMPSPLGIASALACVACGIYIASAGRSGLIAKRDGIVVQGAIRRRQWNWSEVREFKITETMFLPTLTIDLVDGGRVRAPGFKGRSRNERDLARERVAELNRRTADARSI
jgi:PH (Pleckstrin Homology) domain-containing protein